jgi:endonuclease YncB( thermonuclease family)
MEAVLVIVFLAGVVVFGLWVRRSDRSGAPAQQLSRPRHPVTIRAVPIVRRNPQPPRFDEKHSRHVDKPRVLTGAAYVTDGDTIKIKKTQIRLFGIDAPELNHPHGRRAKSALIQMCKGQTVRAEISDVDDYGRTVAQCYLPDGRDLSAEMVKLGLAIDWPKFSSGKYQNLETPDARKQLFLADARQKGRMHVWKNYEDRQRKK